MKKETHVHEFLENERPLEYAFVEKRLAQLPGPLLDVGAAHGQILAKYPHATGFDWNEDPRYPRRIFLGNLLCLPHPFGERFSVITCISTLEHLGMGHYNDPVYPFDPTPIAFNQLLYTLKKRGDLLLTIPLNFASPGSCRSIPPFCIPDLCRLPRITLIDERIYFLHNTTGSVKTLGCYHVHKGA